MTPLTRELDSPLHEGDTVSDTGTDTELDTWETPPVGADRHESDSIPPEGGYTITQAAGLLGVHTNTLRKRIRSGKLRATLVEGPTGQEYRIPVAELRALADTYRPAAARGSQTPIFRVGPSVVDPPPHGVYHETNRQADTRETPPAERVSHQSDSTPDTPSSALQSTARAREMAVYTEELLGPWRRRVEEQAEEIGRLKAELHHARTQAQEALRSGEQRAAAEENTAQEIGRLKAELRLAQEQVSGQERSAEELGRLKAELEQARQRIAEFEALTDELERGQAAGAGDGQRPWWRFWSS